RASLRAKTPWEGIKMEAGKTETPGVAEVWFKTLKDCPDMEDCKVERGEVLKVTAESAPIHSAHPKADGNMVTIITKALLEHNLLSEEDAKKAAFLNMASLDITGEKFGVKAGGGKTKDLTFALVAVKDVDGKPEMFINIRYPMETTYDKLCKQLSEFAEANGFELIEKNRGVDPYLLDSEWDEVKNMLRTLRAHGAEYALVSNIGAIELAREVGLKAVGGFRLNVTNSGTRVAYSELGVGDIILSPELTLPQARDIGGGVIVAGRIPLMLTERCFIKDTAGCSECGRATLTDRTGARFPMRREFGHRNVIFNSMPTYMGDKKGELSSASVMHEHMLITTETPREAESMIKAYFSSMPLGRDVRRIGRR
ncbi:MAG: U32 family peptidase, partial [Clostridia bacterium]|nr:U32 family peptidase [Clostridia bacterium]